MPEVYNQADISLVPTISTEGLSLSLLESMASGLPVITTPVGGLGDAIIDNYNALIYDPNHDNICDYIQALAEDEETRLKMGKRNREIAVECFDIEIWKARWRNLLSQFGVTSEKQYLSSKPEKEFPKTLEFKKEVECEFINKPKLVAMMLTHNESNRYLERVIENTLLFCDEIVILDDHSDDNTMEYIIDLSVKYNGKVINAGISANTWDNESELRAELLRTTLRLTDPDWLISIDSDELYEANKMNEQLPYLLSQKDADWVGFRFFDMWDSEEYYRDDDIWPAGNSYAPRMFRADVWKVRTFGYGGFEWNNKRRHCGSIPSNMLGLPSINSSVRVKHLGWMKPEDRERKYKERIAEDPNSEMFPREIYESINDLSPILVKWDDNNIWQTSKLTIAYPPGMEWNIMQQRPHHLLKLAAKDRNRVFFGDDSATGVYEPLPYLTVVNGDTFDCFNSVDILYITSPEQMDRCKNIKYKKLIYDCCDWMNGNDFDLVHKANYILCSSKLLFDHIKGLSTYGNVKNVIYLPNACDFNHFSTTGEPSSEIVEPVIGYMGCIHPVMIDENIIKAIAEKYKLLMIGQNKGMEFNHPNIYTTGHVPYNNLPKLLAQSKVAIIPFRTDSDYLRYSAPIKVWEYLSSGRPVVASPIPELIPLAELGLIRIVENDDLEGWIKAIKQAITEYPNTKGQEWAKNQTWLNRYKIFKQEVLNNE